MKLPLVWLLGCLILPATIYSGDIWDAVEKDDMIQINKLVEDIGIDINIERNGTPLINYIVAHNNTNILDYFVKKQVVLVKDTSSPMNSILSSAINNSFYINSSDSVESLQYLLDLTNDSITVMLTNNYRGTNLLKKAIVTNIQYEKVVYKTNYSHTGRRVITNISSNSISAYSNVYLDNPILDVMIEELLARVICINNVQTNTQPPLNKAIISRIKSINLIFNKYKEMGYDYRPTKYSEVIGNALIDNVQFYKDMIKSSKKINASVSAALIALNKTSIFKMFVDLGYLDMSPGYNDNVPADGIILRLKTVATWYSNTNALDIISNIDSK